MLDLSLAVGHHLLIFAIFGIICAEVWAVRPGLNSAAVARIASLDLWDGILAAAILVVGFCRAISPPRGGPIIPTMRSFGPSWVPLRSSDCCRCRRPRLLCGGENRPCSQARRT